MPAMISLMVDGLTPIDDELWRQALPAITAARLRARELIVSGKWYPREDARSIDTSSTGWPLPRKKDWSSKGPADVPSMFGESSGQDTPFAYSDVSPVQEFLGYATSRADLASRLLPPNHAENPGTSFWNIVPRRLILDVAGRCEALELGDDEQSILPVYCDAERAVLQPRLSCDLLVPLLLTTFHRAEVELSSTVEVKAMSDEIQLARAPDWSYSTVSAPLLGAATHAIVVRNIEIENQSAWYRIFGLVDVSEGLAEVDRAIRALRVVTANPVGYAQAFVRPHDWADSWSGNLPPLVRISTRRKFPEEFEDGGWNKEKAPIEDEILSDWQKVFTRLDGSHKRFEIAARRLDIARTRQSPEDVVLDSCIGLEAMLGKERTEITHRLAQRAATLLRAHLPPAGVYRVVSRIYDRRSEIIHGETSNKKEYLNLGDQSIPTSDMAAYTLELVLRSVAIEGQVSDPSALDSTLLQALEEGSVTEATDST